MSLQMHTVKLDKTRHMGFTHRNLAMLDQELKSIYDQTFTEMLMSMSGGEFHMGALLKCYKWALRQDNPKIDDDDVGEILDESDLTFEELVENLVSAHPYLDVDEMEDEDDEDEEEGEVGKA